MGDEYDKAEDNWAKFGDNSEWKPKMPEESEEKPEEPIKIYFTDLKPSKQRELLPKLRKFFDGSIPSPLIEFDIWMKSIGTLSIYGNEEVNPYLDPHERREQDAQLASENQEPEPEREDGEVEF